MKEQDFEVAVSKFTFTEGVMDPPRMQVSPRAVETEELQRLLSNYQLKYIQPTLHMNKAIAIGSENVIPAVLTASTGNRTYFGMVITCIDGSKPTEDRIPIIAAALGLELRARFLWPDRNDVSSLAQAS